MITFLTGRQRTITVTGTISVVQASPSTDHVSASVDISYCNGRLTEVQGAGMLGDPPQYTYLPDATSDDTGVWSHPRPGYPLLSLHTNWYNYDLTADVGCGHPVTVTVPFTGSIFGSYSITWQCEEWGSAGSYGIPPYPGDAGGRASGGIVVDDRLLAGATLSCSITANGATASDSQTVSRIGYQGAICNAPDRDGWTTEAKFAGGPGCLVSVTHLIASNGIPVGVLPFTFTFHDSEYGSPNGGGLGVTETFDAYADSGSAWMLFGTSARPGVPESAPGPWLKVWWGPSWTVDLVGRIRRIGAPSADPFTVNVMQGGAVVDSFPAVGSFNRPTAITTPCYAAILYHSLTATVRYDPLENEWNLQPLPMYHGKVYKGSGAQAGVPIGLAINPVDLGVLGDDVTDNDLTLLGWPMLGIGGTITQAASWAVDALNAITVTGPLAGSWYGLLGEAPTVSGGIQVVTAAGGQVSALRRDYVANPINLGGYRYLQVTLSGPAGAVSVSIRSGLIPVAGQQVSGRAGVAMVTISGFAYYYYTRTWTHDYQGNLLGPGTFIIDLCCPDSESAATDTWDSVWQDLGLDGPYAGVSHASRLEIGSLQPSSTYVLSLLQQVRI